VTTATCTCNRGYDPTCRVHFMQLPECCGGWGEVIEDGRVVACPICYPEAYGWEPPA
jgi:hypothetical protein